MKDKNLREDSAFPFSNMGSEIFGMSKRFYAACAAMQALVSINNQSTTIEEDIKLSYKFADELLKQENL